MIVHYNAPGFEPGTPRTQHATRLSLPGQQYHAQWRSQGLPTRRAKMRKKISKVWGKIDQNLRKKWGKWNSCPPGTVRLATALIMPIWGPSYIWRNWTILDSPVLSFVAFGWVRVNSSQVAKWKSRSLTCHCHEIYRDEAVCLKSSNHTLKNTIFVNIWNLGQIRENLIFC